MKKIFFLSLFIFLFLFSIKAKALSINYGIAKTKDGNRPYPGDSMHNLIVNNNGYYIASDTKDIYLTFDCGYENGYTRGILKTLREENVKAIFFITGHYLKSATDIVEEMINDGHIIGNHSSNHKNFSKISSEMMLKELKSLENDYYSIFNKKLSSFVRPPEGSISDINAKVLKDNGYTSLYWSLAYVDWYKDKYYSNHYSYNNVIPRLHNGAIILMHTVSKDNMMDLKDIIIEARNQGYQFNSADKIVL